MPTRKWIPNVLVITPKSVPRRVVTLPGGQTYKSHPRSFTNSLTNPQIARPVKSVQPQYNRLHHKHTINRPQTHSRPITKTTMTSSTSATPTITYQPTSNQDSPLVHCFFDESTSTWTYIAVDPASKATLVIDSVMEYDLASGTIGTQSVRELASFVESHGYKVERIIETHVHADHATGARALKSVRTPHLI